MNESLPHNGAANRDTAMAEELALLGHDIRSAIADVMAGLALINDEVLPEPDRRQLNRAKVTTASLARYLEDGLTTLLAQAAPKLNLGPTNLAQLVQDLTNRWCYPVGQNQSAIITTAANLPDTVVCNHTALDRILSNLISNAITHSGGQTIHLTIARAGSDQIRFTVTDRGPGFPANIDAQASKGSAENSALPAWHDGEGHGLGLSIARTLAHRIGAALDLRNHHDGAMATLTLPIGSDLNAAPPFDTRCLNGKQVLIADDSMPQLLLLGKFLCESGAEITMVRDGVAAEKALRAGRFDLALIDLEMPGSTGLQICASLRDTPLAHANPTRLVIMTAHHLPAVRQNALAAGANQVIVKPITSTQSLMEKLCTTRAAKADQTAHARPQIDITAFERLLVMAGPDMAAELLARYHEDLTAVQTKLHTSLPTLDWPNLHGASHVLVALAGTAGAATLEGDARAFNTAANDQNDSALSRHKDAVLDGLADLITLILKMDQDSQQQRQET